MSHDLQFYIDGAWTDPVGRDGLDVIDPSTEHAFARIALGTPGDVDKAVAAAKRAFASFAETTPAQRRDLLRAVVALCRKRERDLAAAISREMGAPLGYALDAQVASGIAHFETMVDVLGRFVFSHAKGTSLVVKEPVGVVGMITPWNWPMNQIACKVAPALAAGCTMVLKPSEIAPLDAVILAEILHEAGVPAGVFNLVHGDGPTVGQALATHPDVDMMSFTGSTRAGILVARAAAATVKRVHQELGGKSANILLPDVDLAEAVAKGVAGCFDNAGQSCDAPTLMFVPRERHDEAAALAGAAAERVVVGPADDPRTASGPVVSRAQFDKIQDLIGSGIAEGATLVTGGVGRPPGHERGYFVRPTVFADVTPTMRIAREEIFGTVLSIRPYDTVDAVVEEVNAGPYGLASYIQSRDRSRARALAARMRTGNVHLNYPAPDLAVPFGGYKQSGNGREYAEYGLEDYLETKAIIGYGEA